MCRGYKGNGMALQFRSVAPYELRLPAAISFFPGLSALLPAVFFFFPGGTSL